MRTFDDDDTLRYPEIPRMETGFGWKNEKNIVLAKGGYTSLCCDDCYLLFVGPNFIFPLSLCRCCVTCRTPDS